MKKRIISFVLVLCLMMVCLPLDTSAQAVAGFPLPVGQYQVSALAYYSGGARHGCYLYTYGPVKNEPYDQYCLADIVASANTPIYSVADGTVITNVKDAGNGTGGGNYLVIRHNDGTYSYYGHMIAQSVYSVGSSVKAMTEIGKVGMTGSATGYHLHFEWSGHDPYCEFKALGYISGTQLAASVFPHDHGGNSSIQVSVATTEAKDITKTSATLYGTLSVSGGVATECGMYLGTSSTNMTKLGSDSINKSSTEMWYSTSKYGRTLSPGTTYYYEAYAVVGGKTYWGGVKSFKTDGDATVSRPTVNNVTVSGSNVTVSWSSVADATSYDAYLLQAPWGWEDIKYSKSLSSGITSFTFTNVKPGAYTAFVVARPNDNYTQSNWYDFTVDDVSISVKTDKSSYSLGEEVIIIPSYTGVSSYEIEISHKKNGTYVKEHSSTGMARQTGYTPKNTGEYRIDVLASNGMSASTGWCYFTVSAPLPSNPKVVTDKSSYTLGETVTFTPSATDASRYTISVYLDGTLVFSNYDGFTGTISYKPTAIGNYKVDVSCINDSGFVDATNTFTVSSKPAPSGVSVKTDKESYTLGQPVRLYTTYTNADYYYFYVYTTENGRDVLEQSFTSGYNSKTGDNGFTPTKAGLYKIKITAIGAGGETDAWCSFYVCPKASDAKVTFTARSKQYTEKTNAIYSRRITVSGTPLSLVVRVGIYVYDRNGKVIASISEEPEISDGFIDVLYDFNKDLKLQLNPGTDYSCQFFATITDSTDWVMHKEGLVPFKTKGTASSDDSDPNEDNPVTPFDPTPENSFIDVPNGAYFAKAVNWAVDKGITAGTSQTTFSPNQPCTRAQAVTFLWRAAGSPEPSGSNTKFTDVPDGKYYTKAVQWAVEKGITGGTSANTFSPNDKCTRAQIVCFLHRFHNSPVPAGVSPFTDVPAAVYYSSSVAWAVENGITSGISSTQFGPHNDCNRGQIVTFLYRDLG